MELPPAQFVELVEELAKMKGWKFVNWLPGYDWEDVRQEIAVSCLKALPSFDPANGTSLKSYLNFCTENHLRNVVRWFAAKRRPTLVNEGDFLEPMCGNQLLYWHLADHLKERLPVELHAVLERVVKYEKVHHNAREKLIEAVRQILKEGL